VREMGIDPDFFGLDCMLRRMLTPADDLTTGRDAHRAVVLFRALLTCGVSAGKKNETGKLTGITFSQPTCGDFMMVHTSGGVEWFNKERFEELSEWQAVIDLARLAEQRPATRTVTAWLAAAERDLTQRADLAAHAGYRTALFLRLLETTDNGERKDISAKIKPKAPGKKDKNIKDVTRKRPAKAPTD